MKWYYQIAGGHTHVKVYMNGAKCGELCFRNEEFQQVKLSVEWTGFQVQFIEQSDAKAAGIV